MPEVLYKVEGTSHDGFIIKETHLTKSEAHAICRDAGLNPVLCITEMTRIDYEEHENYEC